MDSKEQLKIAEEIAEKYYAGKKRTIGRKEDYIEHPKRIASHFSTDESKIVALLHDILEESNITPLTLVYSGIPAFLVQSIELLTKKNDESYLDYILFCKSDEMAKKIKIGDIRDNLEHLPNGTLRDKYLLALFILEN